ILDLAFHHTRMPVGQCVEIADHRPDLFHRRVYNAGDSDARHTRLPPCGCSSRTPLLFAEMQKGSPSYCCAVPDGNRITCSWNCAPGKDNRHGRRCLSLRLAAVSIRLKIAALMLLPQLPRRGPVDVGRHAKMIAEEARKIALRGKAEPA